MNVATHCPTSSRSVPDLQAPSTLHLPARLTRDCLSAHDFDALAKKRLPAPLYSFVAGGSEDHHAHVGSREAFLAYRFVPRVLCNVARVQQHVTVFGRSYQSPFGIAPMGGVALTAYDGDLALARGAAHADIPMVVSGAALTSLEAIRAQASNAWFQAYLSADRDADAALLDRVAAAGYETLVVTVDVPVAANREHNKRSGYTAPLRPNAALAWQALTHPRWLVGTLARTLLMGGVPRYRNLAAGNGARVFSSEAAHQFSRRAAFDWQDLARIRQRWRGNLVLKGILSAADTVIAREHGVDGVIVSNHGGRQLDSAIAPLTVLPEIVDAAAGLTVMIDSGIRRGTDILKALALGAQMVFIGRPFNFAAAVGGAPGVAHLAALLRDEIARDMALLGVSTLDALHSGFLRESRHPVSNMRNHERPSIPTRQPAA
ncbi:alpha-hydroxy acid oxidase [Paraburkholderia xenovorans]|uniref:alpha-hydroxy acid oxidase n=1 Tax=Paraburkholderia xenovorans TaxID=36873 RepID=UPI000589F6F6